MGNKHNEYTNEQKELKKSYYELLSKNFKRHYDDNFDDIFNLNYSLFRKDFEKNFVNQRISERPVVPHFIPWKLFLTQQLNYIAEQNGVLWAHSLSELISSENFPEQTKFQNLFFYQEYRILTNPKLTIKDEFIPEEFGYINNIKAKDYSNDIDDPLLEPLSLDPLAKKMHANISNKLMSSFLSADSGNSYNSSNKQNPNVEYKYNKTKIKEYMDIFKQHLSIKEHPINFVIIQFINQFIPKVNEVIDFYKKYSEDNKKGCEEKAEDIIKQLQEFIVLIQLVIKLFYSRSISYSYFRDEKDEFLNLVCFLVFNNDKLYKKIFELLELKNLENKKKLEEKYQILGNLLPEEIGIKERFCLNKKTKDYMETLKKEKESSEDTDKIDSEVKLENKLTIHINGEEKIIADEEDINPVLEKEKSSEVKGSINDSVNLNRSRLSSDNFKITSESGKLNIFTKDIFKYMDIDPNEPYNEAIIYLRKIIDFKVPLEKLIVVSSTSNLITECVNKYWKSMEKYIKPEMLSIDVDELMTIFIYIIYKCKMPLLFVHADFINYFVTPATKSSMIGYYYNTLRGSLDFLLEINSKDQFLKESIE